MSYALDTNHAAALYRGDDAVTRRVQARADAGALFCLPTPVVGELYFMVFNSARQASNLERLVSFLAKQVAWVKRQNPDCRRLPRYVSRSS